MGSETKIVPTTSTSSGETKLPAWVDTAGQNAVDIASKIANKPYEAYTGPLVAGLSPNTQAGSQIAADSAGAGQGALNLGLDQTANAADIANKSVGTGQGALAGAAGAIGDAGAKTTAAAGAGTEYMPAIQNLFTQGGNVASATAGAGLPEAMKASNAASGALNLGRATIGAGQGDLATARDASGTAANVAQATTDTTGTDVNAARNYTDKSASRITGDDINAFMNPYISGALDPAAKELARQSALQRLAITDKAGMRGAYGGGRQSTLEVGNEHNLDESMRNLYETGYANAYDKASSMASDEKARQAGAAGLSLQTGGLVNTGANDAISRLTQAASSNADIAKTGSALATDAQGRILAPAAALQSAGAAKSGLASDSLNRLIQSQTAGQSAAGNESNLASEDVNRSLSVGGAQENLAGAQQTAANSDQERVLASINPAYAGAQAQMQNVQETINNLLETGAIDQTQAQHELDTAYQQFLDQRDWSVNQLNALISTLHGLPYSTTTNVKQTGQNIVQQPSMLGQVAGGALAAASLFASDETAKEDFAPVDTEEVLERLARLPVSTYRYKEGVRDSIGDDGRKRIGPMAQDWGREFSGNPSAKVIPMPEIIGALTAAVQGLEKRTRKLAA